MSKSIVELPIKKNKEVVMEFLKQDPNPLIVRSNSSLMREYKAKDDSKPLKEVLYGRFF